MIRLGHVVARRKPVSTVIRWSQALRPRGCEGLTLYEVLKYLVREVRANRLNILGPAVTYNFLMAIPPTLLFLFSLIPYLRLKGVEAQVTYLIGFIPYPDAQRQISSIVLGFLKNQEGGALSFGILLTLFFSSNGMMGLMRSFDRSAPLYKKRSGMSRRWMAIKLTLMLIIVAIITLAVFIIQSRAINGLLERWFVSEVPVKIFSLAVLIGLIFLSICIIYRYGPSLTRRFRFVSPGSVVATVMSLLITMVFFYLVNHVLHYDRVYGAIGSVIAMMVWLYLNTHALLLGFMLNVAVLHGARELGRQAKGKEEKILA